MSPENCILSPSSQRPADLVASFITFLLVLFSAIASVQVLAQTPAPNLPLPPCVTTQDGKLKGACQPQQNDEAGYSLEVEGRLSGEGSSVYLTATSAIPPCDKMGGDGASTTWSPSPCYLRAGFGSGLVTENAQCSYIDLRDNEFKTGSCLQVLYKDWGAHFYYMAELTGQSSTGRCGDGGETFGDDDVLYVRNPVDRNKGAPWSAVGPSILGGCTVTFLGSRPDGLYGPTWALASFVVDEHVTPFRNLVGRPGASVYVPIDGDLRPLEDIDVAVDAEATITESNWDEGRLFATYTASVTNITDEDAENISLIASFPNELTIVQSVSDTENCLLPGISVPNFTPTGRMTKGGNVNCKWSQLASGDSRQVEIRVRIINATDLDALQSGITLKKFDQSSGTVPQGVLFRVSADDDGENSNNEKIVKVDIPFRTGTYENTEMAMLAMAPYFDYYTDNLFEQCNVYMDDIFSRLEATRLSIPEVFNELSYGNITSGQYAISGTFGQLESSGHVGVVVYPKGTNYRKTGIIIHGTPTQSPLNFNSKLGPDDASNAGFISSSTSLSGFYYRTRTEDFPGFPQYEAANGFEGEYSNNGAEFTFGGAIPEPIAPDPNPAHCALPPNAVAVATESPVDLKITDSAGNVVRTSGDEIVEQGLGMGIHSMAFEHDDGSYGWVIVLPKDDYEVQLTGYATGPYTLTMTIYNDQGEPEETVIQGHTEDGKVETFELDSASSPVEMPSSSSSGGDGSNGSGSGGNNRSGGGGSIGLPTLLALIMLSLWLWRRKARERAEMVS